MNLPKKVELIEVGPRDGFQNIKEWIPTENKLAIIDGLISCGFKKMEVTSFVHPKAIPQLADAAEVLKAVKEKHGSAITAIALAPNLFGAKKAIENGADQITFVLSASERHNMENTKQTIEQSLQAFTEVCKIKGKVGVRLAIATAFDCPFLGKTPPEAVIRILEAGLAAGADEVMIADTIGTANPFQMEASMEKIMAKFPNQSFILHIHDTRGMGLANVLTALTMGITRFEAALGGLGGCPFAPGAAGNIATEDMTNLMHDMGIETGIDLEKLLAVGHMAENMLPVALTGHMIRATACKEN